MVQLHQRSSRHHVRSAASTTQVCLATSASCHLSIHPAPRSFFPHVTLKCMPRLSELGPLGTRAKHWYDFGTQAGDANFFSPVIAHIATATLPDAVFQYLRAGQVTPLAKPTGGQRPLLMMSFLWRLALRKRSSRPRIHRSWLLQAHYRTACAARTEPAR